MEEHDTADDVLADPIKALGLPDGAVLSTAVIIVEYWEPGSDNNPGSKRLASTMDDDAAPWTVIGMCEFVKLQQHRLVKEDDG